jgi:hypothetical protein
MKILRIDNRKGQFSINGTDFVDIDKINKEQMLSMLDLLLQNDCDMDPYLDGSIPNEAQQIIYKAIYEKFLSIKNDKETLLNFKEDTFKEAIEKYNEL